MPSPADRFTQLQKVAIFLIALGAERARLLLASMELPTIERLNQTIALLGPVTPEEKAAVMLEFADFFFEGKALPPSLAGPPKYQPAPPRPRPAPAKPAPPKTTSPQPQPTAKKPPPKPAVPPKTKTPPALPPAAVNDDQTARDALDKLREQVDPKQINWGRAGYDFGEGFKGPKQDRR